MMKIFISCPFISKIDGNTIDKEYEKFTDNLFHTCKEFSRSVFMALKREDYGRKKLKKYTVDLDFNEMKTCDLVICIPENSSGVAVELGWASALKKHIILLLKTDKKYSPLVRNIINLTTGEVIEYDGDDSMAIELIKGALLKFEEKKNNEHSW